MLDYVPEDVPAHRPVAIGREVGRTIVDIAERRDSDLVLVGWRGRKKRLPEYVLDSTIDHVVENAPCDVAVCKTSGTTHPKRVLVPVAGNPHEDLVEEVTAALVTANDGDVTLLAVATTENEREQARDIVEECQRALAKLDLDAEMAVGSDSDVARAGSSTFATEGEFDTVVLDATEGGLLHRVVFGDVPEAAGEAFDGEVILLRRCHPVRSFVGRVARK